MHHWRVGLWGFPSEPFTTRCGSSVFRPKNSTLQTREGDGRERGGRQSVGGRAQRLPVRATSNRAGTLADARRSRPMTLDPVLLSRLQFFWVVSFHILLPALTVGLACYIAVLETLYLKTGDHTYFRVSGFWTRIFAVSFGLGVVSGIVMPV